MDVQEIMTELQAKGSDSIKKILLKHGIKEPFFGVKIEYLKPIQKKIKTDYRLSKDLYDTGNADAQYLAGLIADDAAMTKTDLQHWVNNAYSQNIIEYTVPWVAAGSPDGYDLALGWINNPDERIAASGWSTLGNIIAMKPNNQLNLSALQELMDKVEASIHSQPNRVKYTMNGFIIAIACYIPELTNEAIARAKRMSPVMIDMGETACKVPSVEGYVEKLKKRGALGKKKKMVKC